jgi:hypothetical protein
VNFHPDTNPDLFVETTIPTKGNPGGALFYTQRQNGLGLLFGDDVLCHTLALIQWAHYKWELQCPGIWQDASDHTEGKHTTKEISGMAI